jgi:TetR/AcrR family transcriptional regulator of autoinduction and epiphytic fitness
MTTRVKSKRTSRADRARVTRRRIIETATRLFTADGYAATTMEQVAAQSGVAVQTMYYTFGTKGQVLCEAMEFAGAGEHDPIPVHQRPWMIEALAARSPHRSLALGVEHGVDIYERAAPLWPAVNAAALVDPAVERYWSGVSSRRRAGIRRLVGRISELDGLRARLDVERATDIMFVLNGHATFQGLVIEADWNLPTYKAWLYSTLVEQLLSPGHVDALATKNLTFAGRLREFTT